MTEGSVPRSASVFGEVTRTRPWRAARFYMVSLRPSPEIAYMARVLLAVTMAIYAAYWLELESPYSAATTVLVLMNTSRGAVISKSVWRLVGSAVGVAAAIVLVAAFVQTPMLFILGLAAWVGVCSAVASLLRYNRGYGVVLAGYTVTLVALGAIAEPERIFDLATARLAVVSVGVLATAVVFLVTDSGPGRVHLQNRVSGLVARAAGVLRDALLTGDLRAATQARGELARDLTSLDQAAEFASVEDAGFGRFAGDLRFTVAALFAATAAGLHAVALVRRLDVTYGDVGAGLAEALGRLADAEPGQAQTELLRPVQEMHLRLSRRAEECRDVAALAALDQAVQLLGEFAGALESLQALWDGVPRAPRIRLGNYVNFVTAGRNGLRAALAISMAGVFWIGSGWADGSSMLVLLGIVCALASQSDSAALASVDFFKGTVLAIVAAFVCTFGILTRIEGFPLLMTAILPFIAAGVFLGRQSRFATVSLGFLVFFIILVAPGNPMQYDLSRFLNMSCAFLVGGAWAVLSFRILLPPNRRAEAQVSAHSLRNSVQRLARRRHLPHVLAWEHLQHQKIAHLAKRLEADPPARANAIASSAAAIVIGRHLLLLRHAVTDASLPASVRLAASNTIARFRHLCAAPPAAAAAARNEASRLESADAPLPVLHIIATLRDLAQLVTEQVEFFALDGPPREAAR